MSTEAAVAAVANVDREVASGGNRRQGTDDEDDAARTSLWGKNTLGTGEDGESEEDAESARIKEDARADASSCSSEIDARSPPWTLMREATDSYVRTGIFPPVSPRFLRCAKSDPTLAQKRWEDTLRWRAENNINDLLKTPQPFFERIKTHYPHHMHLRSANGCQVYYEQVGRINLKGLHASGVGFDDLVDFYTFEAEFLYTFLLPDEKSQTITVIDCSGLTLRKLPGEAMRFIRTANSIMGAHYPERAFRVYIINAPIYFTVLWRAISSLIDPSTLKKVKVIHGKAASLKALEEFIPLENIPKMYGGRCEIPFGESSEEHKLRNLVTQLDEAAERDNDV